MSRALDGITPTAPEATRIARVPLLAPLTESEALVATGLAHLHNYAAIGEMLRVRRATVKDWAEHAAAKVPGDLPLQMKLIAWWRGAELPVLGLAFNPARGFALDPAHVRAVHQRHRRLDPVR